MGGNKKIALNSIIYVVLGFLTPAVNFLLLPIYTAHLDTSDYALITQSALIQSIFINILGFGVNTAFARYFYDYYKDKEALQTLYATALLSYCVTGIATIVLFSLVGEWLIGVSFKNNIFTFWEYGIYSIMTALFYNMQTVTLSYFRNQEKAVLYAIMSVVFFVFVASSIFLGVVVLDMKAKGSILGRFIGSFLPVFIYLAWFFTRNKWSYSSVLNKKMLLFGLPVVPYLLLNALLAQVDKFAVERYLELSLLGLYGFGFLIASVNDIFITALSSALSPQIYRNFKMESNAAVAKVRLLMKAYISAGLLVNISITVVGATGVHYLINDKYNGVAPYLILLSLAYIPRIFYTNFTIPIFYMKETKILPMLNGLAFLVSVISLITLTPAYGLYGACISRILILLTQTVFAFFYIRNKGYYYSNVMTYQIEYVLIIFTYIYIALWFFIPYIQQYNHKFLLLLPLFFIVLIAMAFSSWRNFQIFRKDLRLFETMS